MSKSSSSKVLTKKSNIDVEEKKEIDQFKQLVKNMINYYVNDCRSYEHTFRYNKQLKNWETESHEIIELPIPPRKDEFPNKLGPFGVLPTKLNLVVDFDSVAELENAEMCYTYEVQEGLVGRFAKLAELGILNTGQLSPSHEINLGDETADNANIPVYAYSFAWAYPLANISNLTDKQKKELGEIDADLSFLVFGGFIYFDLSGSIVQVNAVAQGEALHFSERNWWNPRFTPYLAQTGRFQPVTIQSMRAQGARYFCWIRPNEILLAGDEIWEFPAQYGAFVYLFHDQVEDESHEDCFFSILDSEKIMKSESSPFPLRHRQPQQYLKACIFCMFEARQVIFSPCNHFVSCISCSNDFSNCPLCREKIEAKGDIFT